MMVQVKASVVWGHLNAIRAPLQKAKDRIAELRKVGGEDYVAGLVAAEEEALLLKLYSSIDTEADRVYAGMDAFDTGAIAPEPEEPPEP